MLKIYFRQARRHLLKNKMYAAISVFGLSASVVCILLAVFYWNDERSFDKFHKNNPDLYRVTMTVNDRKTGETTTGQGTGQVQGPAFKNEVPEVVDYVRLMGGGISGDVLSDDKAFRLNTLFSDESFFSVFSFDVLKGNPQTALKDINSVVITESVAIKFFNSIDVIDKQLKLDADPSAQRLGKPMLIKAVVKDPPPNSSIQFDLLLPMKFLQLSFDDDNWQNSYLGTFVVLRSDAVIKEVINKFNNVQKRHGQQQLTESIKTYNYDPKVHYGLQPMTDIHLNSLNNNISSTNESGIVKESKPLYSYLFMGIAVFILVMSCINFINISIANSLKRAKEVGVRKITGGSRSQIIMQFLSESIVLCSLSFIIALVFMQTALPAFNNLTGKQILFSRIINARVFGLLVLIFVMIILMTGFYPAFTLSRFTPTEVLYNKIYISGKNLFGKSLVVFQVSLAVFLMIATLVYYNQMHFIRQKDLGYNPGRVLRSYISGNRPLEPIIRNIKKEIADEPAIQTISFGSGTEGGPTETVKMANKSVEAMYQIIDENFLPLMEIPVIAGRNLSPESFRSDSNLAVIVNDAFVKAAQIEVPVGTQLKTHDFYGTEPKTIIGVVRDFHVGSLREKIKPLIMFMDVQHGGAIYAKFSGPGLKKGLASLERIYKTTVPGAVYSYTFVDQLNASRYAEEQRWQRIITTAAILSIVICCLGLFGLAHIATQQRSKEIGIRKVLGATVTQILVLLSGRFVKLVLLAVLLGAPLAGIVMNQWLQNYAYRININAGMYIVVALSAIVMALLAISLQSIKAALANPVESIKSQ